MKTLLLTLLAIPTLAFPAYGEKDITCALKRSKGVSNTGKASRVIQFRHIGEDVFEVNNFVSYSRAKEYRKTSGGNLVRLNKNENDVYRPSNRLILSANKTELIEDVTGGGYPGGGPAPSRHHLYNCIEGYEFSLAVLKADIKADFNL